VARFVASLCGALAIAVLLITSSVFDALDHKFGDLAFHALLLIVLIAGSTGLILLLRRIWLPAQRLRDHLEESGDSLSVHLIRSLRLDFSVETTSIGLFALPIHQCLAITRSGLAVYAPAPGDPTRAEFAWANTAVEAVGLVDADSSTVTGMQIEVVSPAGAIRFVVLDAQSRLLPESQLLELVDRIRELSARA
jgi:hypothetical protein